MPSPTPVRAPLRPSPRQPERSYGYRYGYGYAGYRRDRRPRKLNWRLVLATLGALTIVGPGLYFWHDFQLGKLSSSLLAFGEKMESEGNWPAASEAYHRVYEISKESDVLGKLAPAYDKHAVHGNLRGVIASYQKAVGELPARVDLRNRLCELLLMDKQSEMALQHANKVLELAPAEAGQAPSNDHIAGLKWHALARLLRYRNGDAEEDAAAVRAELKHAFSQQPLDVELAIGLADFLRTDLAATEGSSDAELADAVMQHLVTSSPEDAEVLLVRSKYRRKYGLEGANQDLDAAVLLAPDDPKILLQAAFAALRDAANGKNSGDFLASRELFKRLVKVEPKSPVGYLGLGDNQFLQGKVKEAIGIWQEGVEEAGASAPLLLRIAEAQTGQQQYEDAEQTLEDIAKLSLGQEGADRKWVMASTGLLRGLILLGRNQPYQAIPQLQTASSLGRDATGIVKANQSTSFTASMHLGQTYEELGQGEDAAAAYERALVMQPESTDALTAAARVWANLGDLTRAIGYSERAALQAKSGQDAVLDLAQYHLERQLAQPPEQRNWDDCQAALDVARQRLPNSWKLSLLELDFLLHQQADKDHVSQMLARLMALEREFPKEPQVWQRLPLIYESLGQTAHADRTLKQLDELTDGSLSTRILLVDVALSRRQIETAAQLLGEIRTDSLEPMQRWAYDQAKLRVLESQGDMPEIEGWLEQLRKTYPRATMPVERLLDLRMLGTSTSSHPSNEALVEELKRRQVDSEPNWQYYAARLELQKPQPSTEVLNGYLGALRTRVPYWSRTQELAGRLADARGDLREARTAYADAIAKPAPNADLYRLLIDHNQRFGDHLANLRLLQKQRQTGSLARMIENGRWPRVQQDLDFLAVDRGLVPSQRNGIWQRFIDKQPVETADTQANSSVAELMFTLAALPTNDNAGKRAVLKRLSTKSYRSRDIRAFTMGQAKFVTGQFAEARGEFEAVDAASNIRLQAELYSGLATQEQSRQNARKGMAKQLARQDQQRLEAMVFLRQGGEANLRRAVDTLRLLVQASGGKHVHDRLLLAECLEQTDKIDAAQEQLKAVVEMRPTARNWTRYCEFLLRHEQLQLAKEPLEQLQEHAKLDMQTLSLTARWTAASEGVEQVEPIVERFAEQHLQGLPPSLLPTRMKQIAAIYQRVGLYDAAERWLTALGRRFPEHAGALSEMLLDIDASDRAIAWCMERLEGQPAADTATLLARALLYGDTTDATREEAMELLEDAVDANPDDGSLLFAFGNLQLKLSNREAAVELYQRATSVQPSHYIAWNNLAALLAEDDNKHDEAMQAIDEAIDRSAYNVLTLWDTKAVVLLQQQQHQAAIDLLQQEVTGVQTASDPRFFFHLAQAHHGLDQVAEAREALRVAEERGLKDTFLTAREQADLLAMRAALSQ